MERLFFALGALMSGLAVAIGAFGAHALRGQIAQNLLETYETGVKYHFYHALGLFAVALIIGRWPNSNLPVIAGWLFVVGIALFSGSLYLLAVTGARWLGAITPLGGVAFIVGWLCLAWVAWRG